MDPAPLDPDRIDAILFDVIGTLVDEDPAWARAARLVAAEARLPSSDDLRRTWSGLLAARMDAVVTGEAPWRPHRELVVDAADEAVVRHGGTASEATRALAADVDRGFPTWPDVADGTAALRRSRLVAGLSNGELDSLARIAHAGRIGWDAVLSTGSVRTFKPAPAAYRHAIRELDLDPVRTLFVAAHPWDLRAAAGHGFRTAYVARPGAERPSAADPVDLAVTDLGQLAALLG
ncbi:haloacid dehalogenase type II [Clavibacter sp. VKM Ac-2872]|uniref:haloacid dehalogenase type II n=1 Tax=Clavibacter sp. VKM Ac-2872 TaxID=2783812 RepID=UPI00188C7C86|nr:haloacid dehalogenase type II [Clavibacter sp. VKM Ac-2872]MBF4625284.1 haloacid dehalogenase type II [Clavibacter sp. VKM Ac-2872]